MTSPVVPMWRDVTRASKLGCPHLAQSSILALGVRARARSTMVVHAVRTRSWMASGGVHGSSHWCDPLGPNQFTPTWFHWLSRRSPTRTVAATAAITGVPASSSRRSSDSVCPVARLKASSRYCSWFRSPLPSWRPTPMVISSRHTAGSLAGAVSSSPGGSRGTAR